MRKIKIIIVDDHALFREGLRSVLEQNPEFEIIAEASNGKEFLELLDSCHPDVVLLDILMPVLDGITAAKLAMSKQPGIKIIMLTMFGDEEYFFRTTEVGTQGFLLKQCGSAELCQAINVVMSGGEYCSQLLVKKMISVFRNTNKNDRRLTKDNTGFTEREKDILSLICNGVSNEQIAEKLHLSKRTIEGYKTKLFEKTQTKNTIELIVYMSKNKPD
jgi:DNA-binding NarL/FixJ family response regulator